MPSFEIFNRNKANVLKVLARKAFEGTVDANTPEGIARELFPGRKPQYRCCVYKEREIIRERTNMAMGRCPDGRIPENSGQLVYVLEAACDDCNIHKVRITDNCRKCLFKPCQQACHFDAIYQGDSKMHIDYSKCKTCGMCARVCAYGAILISERPCRKNCPTGALKHLPDEIAYINEDECISCGRCAASCPFGAISELSFLVPVINALKSSQKVVALVAPAVQGQFGKCSLNQIYRSITALGFDSVVEVARGADLTTVAEAEEALRAKAEGRRLTTSCCPAFVELIKKKFPKVYAENTSDTLSPMALTARLVKKYDPECVTVFIGPCVAKKKEITLKKNQGFVDYVLTFEELTAMFEARGIDVAAADESDLQVINGSKSGRNFCHAGGVAQSLNAYLAEKGVADRLTLKAADGSDMCVEYLKVLAAGRQEEDVLEGMMCQGGCIAGVCSLVTNPNVVKREAEKENAKADQTSIGSVREYASDIKTDYVKDDVSVK